MKATEMSLTGRQVARILVITSVVAALGCAPKPVDTYETFPITIVLAGQLVANAEDALPEEVIKVTLPVYGKECELGFIPRVSFVRADREPPNRLDLEPMESTQLEEEIKQRRQNKLGWIQQFLAQKPSPDEVREAVMQRLRSVRSGEVLAADTSENPQLDRVIAAIVQKQQGLKVFVLVSSEEHAPGIIGHLREVLPKDSTPISMADHVALTQAMEQALCDQIIASSDAEKPAELRGFLVVYEPGPTQEIASPESELPKQTIPEPLEPTQGPLGPPSVGPLQIQEQVDRVREDLKQGRLDHARQSMTDLYHKYPQDAHVKRLKEEIDQDTKARIEFKLLGETGGQYILNEREALIVLSGTETSFRFYVEPYEELYFYLYRFNRDGRIKVLFPFNQPSGNDFNPLHAGQAYWLPSAKRENGYPLDRGDGELQKITMVTSRWPAADLEKWGAVLTGGNEQEASRRLLQVLIERQKTQVGGCDVRSIQFARKGGD